MASARTVAEGRTPRHSRPLAAVAPALVIIFLAAVGPLLIVLLYSFMVKGDYGDVKYGVLAGRLVQRFLERDIFDDTLTLADAHMSIFWRSVKLSLITTLLTLIFGFPTAYFIATATRETRDIWLFLITIPFWTNLLIRTFAIQEVIRNEGLVNSAADRPGIIDTPMQIMFTDRAILFGMIYVYLPLMVLPLYASMEKLDFRLVEAGYDLYATRFQVLRKIIIPLVKPGMIAGSILVFIPSLGAYVTPRASGRRQEHDAWQSDRTAVRSGPQLAAGFGPVDNPHGDRHGRAARLCPQCLPIQRRRTWLDVLHPPPAGLHCYRHACASSCSICPS